MTSQIANSSTWPPRIVVCVGTVVLEADRALLIRQAEGHPLQGQWSISWGVVEENETPENAALRETHEEAGVVATLEGLLGIQNLPTPGWLGIIFLCRHEAGFPHSNGGAETDRAAYFSLVQMDRFEEPFEAWCAWLVRRVLSGSYHLTPLFSDNPYLPRQAFF